MKPVECANCEALEAPGGAALKPCARCKSVVYCGMEYQISNWKALRAHQMIMWWASGTRRVGSRGPASLIERVAGAFCDTM